MFTNMIGMSEKANSCTLGNWVRSAGRSVWALSTASLTFCFAISGLMSVSNSTMIKLKSVCEVELILFTFAPEIPFICFSIGRVTRFSISVGEFPTYTVVTDIVGTTISGNCSLGNVKKIYIPNPVIIIVMTYMVVRLSIAQLEGKNSLNFCCILFKLLDTFQIFNFEITLTY